ncbi:MAG: YIP1 family protein [Fidelibacterota bacterium]|nr:MAG: YIP1 family protein [Candidatus Neomarinimicrobiota bacterium]
MDFVGIWFRGLVQPVRAFDALKSKPAPWWGLKAVLVRYVGTSLTTTLALYLLDRRPFEPSYLTFLSEEHYYRAEIFFLPLFGLFIWLLGAATVHLVLSLTGKYNDFNQVLNIMGMSMLIVMPGVWLWDWVVIILNYYHLTIMAVSHSVFALWGVGLYTIGFNRILGLRVLPAFALAFCVTLIYIPLAAIFVR